MFFLRFLSITIIFFSIILPGCGNENKNRVVQESFKKEEELLKWENQLESREQALKIREERLDSLNLKTDTFGTYNPKLIGNWSARMLCTETTCSGSAIGDTKTEQWNIRFENNRFIVKASSNNVITRIYTGAYIDDSLKLTADQGGDKETTITINLMEISDKKMEGSREINQAGICKITYSIEVERSKIL